MRLTEQEIQLIITGLEPFMANFAIELRLYGSRINNALKGGDIDLLLVAEKASVADSLLEIKHQLLANIKKYTGDQKIDLTVCAAQDLDQDPFLRMIFPTSILLHAWR